MSAPETPKFSGPNRRWGRPFGELSPLHSIVAIALVVLIFGLLVVIVVAMKQ
jgi:hypothetical protein